MEYFELAERKSWVELVEIQRSPGLRVAISIESDMTGLVREPDDPSAATAAEILEAGLERLLRTMPVQVNGRYTCVTPIPYAVGDTVQLRDIDDVRRSGTVLAIDPERGMVRVRATMRAWGKDVTEETDVDLLDVRPAERVSP